MTSESNPDVVLDEDRKLVALRRRQRRLLKYAYESEQVRFPRSHPTLPNPEYVRSHGTDREQLLRDLADRQLQTEQLEESLNALADFLARRDVHHVLNLTHDFASCMASVRGPFDELTSTINQLPSPALDKNSEPERDRALQTFCALAILADEVAGDWRHPAVGDAD